ncbi:hypothetical protein [Sansalvadorimonas verongulae]|uniref:hypothetical protein n=1 Tax=Sansalvadorimonas verongulae TaxID=2172824 RepID=UPI0012BD4BFD|nr:hypothetical protein [Sansalvadorimonas verongulae]MTI13917.1 hypothetical protein [Sansalvadorimonas verongulae]
MTPDAGTPLTITIKDMSFAVIEQAVQVRVLSGFGKISPEVAKIIVCRGLKEENGQWLWRRPISWLLLYKVPALLVVAKGGMLDKAVQQFADTLDHIEVHSLEGEHHLQLEGQAGDVVQVIQPFFTLRMMG